MNDVRDGKVSKWALFSWALYDWANSAFFAVIQTFVFATYFVSSIAENDASGSAYWGNTIGAAGLVIAVLGPVLGSIADQTGRRKPWIFGFSLLCILATGLLWFVEPSNNFLLLALVLIFLGTVGSEAAIIFYNAMLPTLVENERMGRWSGWAWGLGYAGGLVCLVVSLFLFIQVDVPPFGLDPSQAEGVRATFVLVAVWYLLFSIPLFTSTPDLEHRSVGMRKAVRNGWKQLKTSIKNVQQYKPIVRFLVARMIFIDALATVFAFGGIYAAGTFDMTERDVLIFGIGLNLTAGLGAALFAWIDDWLGSKKTILYALAGLILTTSMVLLVRAELWFWVFGLLLGVFVGPVQAASRTYMGRIAPENLRNQMFGLFALSGKVTAFVGPILVGWLSYLAGSQRIGMSIIVLFFIIGMVLMLGVPEVTPTKTLESENNA
ncbi:MFS transporter [Aliifodinibius sp. S!AR15-10]|uniref:MFS transporter n=1 Tax=Aliifodinibius sp. S!AR15-10 TaxID=2950437 RepID=UPI002866900E|nr:MFS transporter [Aliifodinibius sp. S!AR15-10]MDR8389602.1 MFS transporter [Aliifodinibius sp. S!AR15-10]